jgi:3',5'-cyclic AMP phosphodiesterase CpdA
MRLAWITDPHFDFLPPFGGQAFGQRVVSETDCDAVVVTGDIAVSHLLKEASEGFAAGLGKPVYFVLGNHDYYGGSIQGTRAIANQLGGSLRWLHKAETIRLNDETALVGHEGWYDAQYGDAMGSRVWMSDFDLIEDLRGLSRQELILKLFHLGREAAQEASVTLAEALARYRKVLMATHYPPFDEACWHEGSISNRNWLPWFTCKAMGDMLLASAEKHPEREILVLCGHTHSPGKVDVAPNLEVWTGGARYGAPEVAHVFEF